MENKLIALPEEITIISEKVPAEKRNEVQVVLTHVFNGVEKMKEQLNSVVVTDENDIINMKLANTIRLGVKNVRLDAEKTFDAKRAEVQQQMIGYKTEDQLWLKAKQTMQLLTKELEENARWKEETAKRYLVEQKELKTQQRILKVAKFSSEITRDEFEFMGDESFNIFLAGIEKQYSDKIEAEKKVEEARIAKEKAEREERKRIAEENEKLKKEAIEREKLAKIEAEKRAEEEEQRKEQEAKLLAEHKQAEEDRRIQAEKARKLASELKAKEEAENKAKEEEAARLQAELNKGDAEKVKDLIADLEALKTKYTFDSTKNNTMYNSVGVLIDKTIKFIKEK